MKEQIKKVSLIGVLVMVAVIFSGCASKKEGIVKYDDCREVIELNKDSYERYYKDFTCEYRKTKSGKIMWGLCISVKIKDGECRKAYIYEVEQEAQCPDSAPYLGYDDMCHSEIQ